MALGYKDFFPILLESGVFKRKFEDLATTLGRANKWLATSGLKIVNVETLLLPNVSLEAGASITCLYTGGETSSSWIQVIRVWYHVPDPGD
ncbi:MAG: hypothetical protein CFE26_14465 [Verrucomicrobiales bacterium VVV1]|nr:MAG: hypothetical protein CFE26_14465 [Verrucomicrobiales bacterium VVV1]